MEYVYLSFFRQTTIQILMMHEKSGISARGDDYILLLQILKQGSEDDLRLC
jgi:hypothetical protein